MGSHAVKQVYQSNGFSCCKASLSITYVIETCSAYSYWRGMDLVLVIHKQDNRMDFETSFSEHQYQSYRGWGGKPKVVKPSTGTEK